MSLQVLQDAFGKGDLTLYLGAGVSVGNGLPTWERLVLAMYFVVLQDGGFGRWRPFANYLYAIAEWHLRHAEEPLEITARKLRLQFSNQNEFLAHLKDTLYAGLIDPEAEGVLPDANELRTANPTLDAIANICAFSSKRDFGVDAVISYNYDELLESAMGKSKAQPVWAHTSKLSRKLPVYHVHGYVPYSGRGSKATEIVFTEDQYHLAAQNTFSWSNLVQLKHLSNSVGLMIGLSLSDRNIRRLFDAMKGLPSRPRQFALLRKPKWAMPNDRELDSIHSRALQYLDDFERSGTKINALGRKGPSYRHQIQSILKKVRDQATGQHTTVLEELGITPIWYENHQEIPEILEEIYC